MPALTTAFYSLHIPPPDRPIEENLSQSNSHSKIWTLQMTSLAQRVKDIQSNTDDHVKYSRQIRLDKNVNKTK